MTHEWFLTSAERGNPATDIDSDGAWTEGNLVRPLVHGATYFKRLYDELCELRPGDRVCFTDWCGDQDEVLYDDGPTIGAVLCDLARSGVEVRALLWRSHSDHVSFNAQENQRLGTELNEAGAEASWWWITTASPRLLREIAPAMARRGSVGNMARQNAVTRMAPSAT